MSLTYRLAFVLFFASFTPGHAASFDCTRAGTAHERHICLDPVLNASDTMMGTVFRSAVEAFPVPGFPQATQRRWLVGYANCERNPGQNCIDMVLERIEVLRSMMTPYVYTNTRPGEVYQPDDGVLWLDLRNGNSMLHTFGSYMPDMTLQEPFPRGFVCDSAVPVNKTSSGWEQQDGGDTIRISNTTASVDMSCSPRNGMHGDYERVGAMAPTGNFKPRTSSADDGTGFPPMSQGGFKSPPEPSQASQPSIPASFAQGLLTIRGRWTDGRCSTRWNDVSVSELDLIFHDQSGGMDLERVVAVQSGAFVTKSVVASKGPNGALWRYEPINYEVIKVQNLSTGTTFLLRRCPS